MPVGSELAAASNVRHYVDSATLQPRRANPRRIPGNLGNPEAAVAVEQCRARFARVVSRDLEIGNPGPVGGRGPMLRDGQAVRVELARCALQHNGVLTHRRKRQVGRGQVVGGGEEEPVVLVGVYGVGVEGLEPGGIDALKRGGGPAFGAGCRDFDAVAHVVQDVDENVVAGQRIAGQRCAFTRFEQDCEAASAGEEAIQLEGDQAPRRKRGRSGSPVAARCHVEPAAVHRVTRVGRDLKRYEFLAAANEAIAVVEVAAPIHELHLETRGQFGVGAHRDIRGFAFEDGGGFLEGLTASPQFDDPRIAGVGHRAGTEIRRHEDLVGAGPSDGSLGLGEREAVFHEGLGDKVELPDNGGVGAAPGQTQQAAVVGRNQDGSTRVHPVLILIASQGIDVEHDLPGGVRLPVFLERRPPPQATGVGLILPKVVVPVAGLVDVGDAIVGIEDPHETPLQRIEGRVFGKRVPNRIVSFPDPRQRLVATDILQPEIGILVSRTAQQRHGHSYARW